MRATCPACGVTFEREPGFFAGALFVNLAFTEILMFLWLAGVLFATIPHPRVAPLVAGAVAICLTVPIAAYPFAKTVWFAIHVAMQPLDPREEAARAAVRFERGDHEFIVDSSGPSRPPG